jgi:protein subunit release factor A
MIDKNDVEVLVHRDDSLAVDVAVLLTHKPTGITVESWDRESQIANYEAAMAELERRVSAVAGSRSLLARLGRWLSRSA